MSDQDNTNTKVGFLQSAPNEFSSGRLAKICFLVASLAWPVLTIVANILVKANISDSLIIAVEGFFIGGVVGTEVTQKVTGN